MALDTDTYVVLDGTIKDRHGEPIAHITTNLRGDGATPEWVTTGVPGAGSKRVKGYNDYGAPIYDETYEEDLKKGTQEFMAQAIKKQKELTRKNGGDPSKVNIIGAEKE